MKNVTNIKTTRDDARWETTIEGQIPPEALALYRALILKDLAKTVQLKGFRAGHAPEAEIIRAVGEEELLRRTTERAVRDELPELIAAEKINIVDSPRVTIETPKPNTAVSFVAIAPLAPAITLPDYAAIAQRENAKRKEVTVEPAEYDDTITHLRRERSRAEKIDAGTDPQTAFKEAQALDAKDLPALDDEFVKSIGYESEQAFRDKLREQLLHEKTLQENSKHRTVIIDALVKNSKISYPALLCEYELDDMEARLEDDLKRINRTLDSYYEETKKTRETLRKEWQEAADKRVKMRLILAEIARKENIEPDQTILEHELTHAKKHYPEANPETLRAHIAHAMRNDAVLSFLESQSA